MNGNVSKFIYNLRKKNNLTQQELAEKLGVTYQAVSKWENGKSIPDILILQQISKDFNVDITEILEGKKTNNKNWLYFVIPTIFIVLAIVGVIILKQNESFEFKSIDTDNKAFSIDGVIAYSKDKSSIYISSINMNEESSDEFKVVKCTLYENHNNIDKEISKCENSSDNATTLKELLNNISFYVNDNVISCNELSNHNLYLTINALDEFEKEVSYKIPLKFVDYCEK